MERGNISQSTKGLPGKLKIGFDYENCTCKKKKTTKHEISSPLADLSREIQK